MKTHTGNSIENKIPSRNNVVVKNNNNSNPTFHFSDLSTEASAERDIQQMANNSAQIKQMRAFSGLVNNHYQSNLNPPIQRNKKKSLRSRVRKKLIESGYDSLTTREKGFVPKKPKADALEAGKSNLKKTSGMSTMYPHVEIKRGGKNVSPDDPLSFLEFASQTRRDMTNLSATDSGREIFDVIGNANKKVTLQDRGSNPDHGGSHKAHNSAAAKDPLKGSDSTVTHQPDRSQIKPRPHAAPTSSTLSLGHELIHSTHSATGTLQSGVHAASGVKNEERHTVGNPSLKRPKSGLPTENILRAELAKQYETLGNSAGKPIPRTKYGKNLLGFNPEEDQY